VESRRVRLLLYAVAVPGLFTGAWACGSRTGVEFGDGGVSDSSASTDSGLHDGLSVRISANVITSIGPT